MKTKFMPMQKIGGEEKKLGVTYKVLLSTSITFSITSTYSSTYLPTLSANFSVRGSDMSCGISGKMESYPWPA